ncbi:MAG: hypothetical protein LCH53_13095 [Bacteroidetes bacterium]|nr:hypothetical protein [Bacteroidota bacterium]
MPTQKEDSTAGQDAPVFQPPKDAARARERIAKTVFDIKNMEAMLADPDRVTPTGRRLSAVKWRKWRAGTLKALHFKQDELQRLKAWLRLEIRRIETAPLGVNPEDGDDGLMLAAYRSLEALRGLDGVPPEIVLVRDALKRRLHGIDGSSEARLDMETMPRKRQQKPPGGAGRPNT